MPVAVNISTIAPALQQLVREAIAPQFEQVPYTYNLIERETNAMFVNGKGFRIPSYLRPPTGLSGLVEGGSFAQPGAETNDDMFVYPAQLAFSFEFTGAVLRNVKDESSLIRGLGGLLEVRAKTLMKEMNINMFGDGSAVRAVFKSIAGNTVTAYAAPADTPGANFGRTKGSTQIRVGEAYDVYDTTLATFRGTVRVTGKTSKTTFVINTVPSGLADGDVFVVANSLQKFSNGFAGIVNNDSGVFQLQSRATYPELKAVVNDLNGSAISVPEITRTKNLLIAVAGVGQTRRVMAIISLAQDQALRSLGQNFKYFDPNDRTYDGSFDSFKHGDTVFYIDPDCDEDRVYLLDLATYRRYEQMPFGLYDLDGQQLRMKLGAAGYGSDAYTGAFGWVGNIGCDEPRRSALIKRCSVVGLATQASS